METINLKEAYSLVKSPVIIASKGDDSYDLTPIGWITPYDYEPVTKVLFSSSPEHKLDANVRRKREFAVLIPNEPNSDFVMQLGTVSGNEVDKFEKFGIKSFKAENIDVLIPETGIKAVLECKLVKVEAEGSVDIFFGECVNSYLM